jgi:uncharacterized BrkB/YihY/UPF0761 family membrane protein
MFKKRYFSTDNDFKTGFLYKISFFLGLLLLIIFIFFKVSSFIIGAQNSGILNDIYNFAQLKYLESILAFSIIFIAVGFILYFFYLQFEKLAKIADEIENEEDSEDID